MRLLLFVNISWKRKNNKRFRIIHKFEFKKSDRHKIDLISTALSMLKMYFMGLHLFNL